MNHNQHPLGTPFSAESTALELVGGIDLTGKNVIVTGGNAGIGLEVARALSSAGAAVTIASRNPDPGLRALGEKVETSRLDLIDPASIEDFAARWLDSGRALHILINNAGMPASPERQTDRRGYEMQFSTNYLGHFQLTRALLPALRAAHGARIVNTSSGAHRFADIRWEDPHFQAGYSGIAAYAQTKTAMVLFAVELDRRYASDGIQAYSAHPGVVVGTALNSAAGPEQLRAMGLTDETGKPIIDPRAGKKTPAQGASTIVFAATSPLLAGIGGVYLKDNDIAPLDDEAKPLTPDSIPADAISHSIDPQSAQRLWKMSEEMLKPLPA